MSMIFTLISSLLLWFSPDSLSGTLKRRLPLGVGEFYRPFVLSVWSVVRQRRGGHVLLLHVYLTDSELENVRLVL